MKDMHAEIAALRAELAERPDIAVRGQVRRKTTNLDEAREVLLETSQ